MMSNGAPSGVWFRWESHLWSGFNFRWYFPYKIIPVRPELIEGSVSYPILSSFHFLYFLYVGTYRLSSAPLFWWNFVQSSWLLHCTIVLRLKRRLPLPEGSFNIVRLYSPRKYQQFLVSNLVYELLGLFIYCCDVHGISYLMKLLTAEGSMLWVFYHVGVGPHGKLRQAGSRLMSFETNFMNNSTSEEFGLFDN